MTLLDSNNFVPASSSFRLQVADRQAKVEFVVDQGVSGKILCRLVLHLHLQLGFHCISCQSL
jgi:hypothetical protein